MRFLSFLIPLALAAATVPDQGRALLEAIHNGDMRAVRAALKAGAVADSKDDMGATALMHAGVFGSVECMRVLLDAGASVNAASNAGFTPLMWAVSDPAKVRLLLARHADPKPVNKQGDTALILARQHGFRESVPLLLAAGAPDEDGMDKVGRPYLKIPNDALLEMRGVGAEPRVLLPQASPLLLASYFSRIPVTPMREMLELGADPNAPGKFVTLELPPLTIAAYFGHSENVALLLQRGANPNAAGAHGWTPLIAAAASQKQDLTVLQQLLDKGAKINAQDENGRTALDWALLRGDSELARRLRAAGGREMAPPGPAPAPVAQPLAAREAVQKAITLIQPGSPGFFKQTGCISCHNNSLPSIAATVAKAKGIATDPELTAHPTKAAMASWTPLSENLATGASSVGGLIANVSYELLALREEGFAPTFVTDAATVAIARLQRSDGSWSIADTRPPLGGNPVTWTALSIQALQSYMPKGRESEKETRIRAGKAYLEKITPADTQETAFALLGLRWSGVSASSLAARRAQLLALQRADGGWGQLPGMASDAYATGQALYALHAGSGLAVSDPAYQRGVQFLLRTQLPDGSWYVRARGLSFQPYRETGLPHGKDQFISAAATSWAAIALSASL